MSRNLYYFVSDVHLGLRAADASLVEKRFISFLDALPCNTKALYLLGDIFDFWYEYKDVIPRGYTRVLGRLAGLKDRGVDLYFFKGNHDIWAYSYFQNEIGMTLLEQPCVVEIEGKKFCLGHGDGLGKTSWGFTLIRWGFRNRFLQTLFSSIHPRWAFLLGYNWSKHSRLANGGKSDNKIEDIKSFPIVEYASSFSEDVDCFVFGHYHTPTQVELSPAKTLFILGDWFHGCEYLQFDGERLDIIPFEENQKY